MNLTKTQYYRDTPKDLQKLKERVLKNWNGTLPNPYETGCHLCTECYCFQGCKGYPIRWE